MPVISCRGACRGRTRGASHVAGRRGDDAHGPGPGRVTAVNNTGGAANGAKTLTVRRSQSFAFANDATNPRVPRPTWARPATS